MEIPRYLIDEFEKKCQPDVVWVEQPTEERRKLTACVYFKKGTGVAVEDLTSLAIAVVERSSKVAECSISPWEDLIRRNAELGGKEGHIPGFLDWHIRDNDRFSFYVRISENAIIGA